MSTDNATFMLVIDHGREPRWDRALALAETISIVPAHSEEYEGFPPEDGAPEDHARVELIDALRAFKTEWGGGQGSPTYEIRRVRDADAHIAYDDPDNPTELWHHGAIIDHYPALWTAAGFDNDRS